MGIWNLKWSPPVARWDFQWRKENIRLHKTFNPTIVMLTKYIGKMMEQRLRQQAAARRQCSATFRIMLPVRHFFRV